MFKIKILLSSVKTPACLNVFDKLWFLFMLGIIDEAVQWDGITLNNSVNHVSHNKNFCQI